MYIVIVGAGNIGFFLAHKLIADKHQVCFIERSEDRADEIASRIVPALIATEKLPESPGEFLLGVGAGLSGDGERQ